MWRACWSRWPTISSTRPRSRACSSSASTVARSRRPLPRPWRASRSVDRMRFPAGRRLRRLGYGVFYALPFSARRRLVRLAVSKYIVGAVALVRDSEATGTDRLLLLRQPPGMGWTLPAGLLRRGESPIDGCVRELAEETGIELGRDQLVPSSPSAVVHYRGRWVDVVFEARVP